MRLCKGSIKNRTSEGFGKHLLTASETPVKSLSAKVVHLVLIVKNKLYSVMDQKKSEFLSCIPRSTCQILYSTCFHQSLKNHFGGNILISNYIGA